ncbi:MAG TPA: valine--tRNA ligase [Candidatus Moranbacteria bacterium]|nr:valine--tRNA ligase [Candidatus Moranbacteria bacterium]
MTSDLNLMNKELPKIYDPKLVEDKIYQKWEESGYFNPDKCIRDGIADEKKPPFSIVLPPPNVTGNLHMGHAAMLAIEDSMVRFSRMNGCPTLWLPGTDHAAIATQSKVEKIIYDNEGKTKHDIGKDEFLKRVGQFAQDSHDTIIKQTKKMGSSLDWTREAYTLDEQRSLAVRTAFKKMYDDGLIYRGYRVINWSVKGQSTCSDDELVHVERTGKIYTFRYGKDFPIAIATTRPETKLGDTAIAVNPADERYEKFIGQTFTVDVGAEKPLEIKVIADANVDPNFGTGALGVTPAHSAVDFEMYEKQRATGDPIELIQVIDEKGLMTEKAGSSYAGLSVEKAREKFIDWLKENNLLEKEEETLQSVGTSDRFGDVVEAIPMTQWFIDVNKQFERDGRQVTLKSLMHEAVSASEIQITPKRFEKIYFHWIENLRDWCISRQIWFGHQIPVWYRADEIYCGIEAPEGEGWEQDPDTLDTWFSSGLWTFSTLGWPEGTSELEKYHPTTILETGYDILFFWVARMILMTKYLKGEIPFKHVYLHGLVRDEKGRKMSKSLGNIIDPLDVIEKYGTDAVRLSLMIGSTPGQDLKLSEDKIGSFRNFTNKLWNIARYVMQTTEKNSSVRDIEYGKLTLSDAWILEKINTLTGEITGNYNDFQFSQIGEKLREFVWNDFADWYIEISKFENNKKEKDAILNFVLETTLKLWHPMMPFVTEHIWEGLGKKRLLMVEKWPQSKLTDPLGGVGGTNEIRFDLIREIITSIRNGRLENNIDPKRKIKIIIDTKNQAEYFGEKTEDLIRAQENIIKSLRTGIEELEIISSGGKIENSIQRTVGGINIYIPLEGLIDIEKEREKAQKEIGNLNRYISGLEGRLSNKEFVSKAPEQVIRGQQESLAKAKAELEAIEKQLKNLN